MGSYNDPALTIAVVDDDPEVLDFLRSVIQLIGHHCLSFQSGRGLLVHGDLGKIDILILDLEMPLMDGLSLARSARALPELSRKPIIALSGGNIAASEALRAGFDDYWTKPINLSLLYEAIRARLKQVSNEMHHAPMKSVDG